MIQKNAEGNAIVVNLFSYVYDQHPKKSQRERLREHRSITATLPLSLGREISDRARKEFRVIQAHRPEAWTQKKFEHSHAYTNVLFFSRDKK